MKNSGILLIFDTYISGQKCLFRKLTKLLYDYVVVQSPSVICTSSFVTYIYTLNFS